MLPIFANTATEAWLGAVDFLIKQPKHRASRIILEIRSPLCLAKRDADVCKYLDEYIVSRGGLPLNTVSNTIFPYGLYRRYGVPEFYNEYKKVFPQLRKHCDHRSWGTYFHRMTVKFDKCGKELNPLQYLIEKLGKITNHAAYELNFTDLPSDLPIYDAPKDKHHPVGGPCLSHTSFSVSEDGKLDLTALYRSHYYIQRALGNLFGLAALLDFVATQAKFDVGTLTCISNTAQLEVNKGWKKSEVKELVSTCLALSKKTEAA